MSRPRRDSGRPGGRLSTLQGLPCVVRCKDIAEEAACIV